MLFDLTIFVIHQSQVKFVIFRSWLGHFKSLTVTTRDHVKLLYSHQVLWLSFISSHSLWVSARQCFKRSSVLQMHVSKSLSRKCRTLERHLFSWQT